MTTSFDEKSRPPRSVRLYPVVEDTLAKYMQDQPTWYTRNAVINRMLGRELGIPDEITMKYARRTGESK